jgi:hypothetical protein
MKTRGLEEVQRLRTRARRQLAFQRISKSDYLYIDQRLDEIEARIIAMREYNESGEEE